MPSSDRRTIPREKDAPRPLIALMILAMLGGVAGVFGWIQRTGIAENVVGRPAPLARERPVFAAEEILSEPAKGNLLGRDVAIWRAPVQEVAGDWLFWIGDDAVRTVPVVLVGEQTARQGEPQTEVRLGDTLAIFGFVRAVRDASLLDEPWSMREDEWARLRRALIYISAIRIEHLARDQRSASSR